MTNLLILSGMALIIPNEGNNQDPHHTRRTLFLAELERFGFSRLMPSASARHSVRQRVSLGSLSSPADQTCLALLGAIVRCFKTILVIPERYCLSS